MVIILHFVVVCYDILNLPFWTQPNNRQYVSSSRNVTFRSSYNGTWSSNWPLWLLKLRRTCTRDLNRFRSSPSYWNTSVIRRSITVVIFYVQNIHFVFIKRYYYYFSSIFFSFFFVINTVYNVYPLEIVWWNDYFSDRQKKNKIAC